MRKSLQWLVLVSSVAVPLSGAGSGTLWFRCTTSPTNLQCTTDTYQLPAMRVDAAGPVALTITSQSGGSMNLGILDSCGNSIYTNTLTFGWGTSQTITFTAPTPGVYRIKPGGDIWQGRFRFDATTAKFVMPGGIDWDPYPDAVAIGSGSYYFFVPAGTTAFTVRVHAGFPLWGPEWGAAYLYDPHAVLRLSVPQGQGDRSFTVAVPPGTADGFWRIDATHCGDLRLYVTGVPAFFAETPDSWFMPDVSVSAASGRAGQQIESDTAVFCPGMAVEFLSPADGSVLGTAELATNNCGHFGFIVPNLPAGDYRLRVSGCGMTSTSGFAILGAIVPVLHPIALTLLVAVLAAAAVVALRK